MIRRTSIILVELTAALAAGFAILAGVGFWYLSAGPFTLAFLTPYIEQALTPEDGRFRVKIDDTVLTLAGLERPVDVRARDVQIYVAGQSVPLATLSQVSIGVSLRALFRGMVAPTRLEIFRPSVHITRAEDGHFELGLSDRPGGDETAIQGVLAGLGAPPDERLRIGYLRTVRIREAELTLSDKRLNLSWVVPATDITLSRDESGVKAAVELAVEVLGQHAELSGELLYDFAAESVAFTADFTNVQPATYSAAAPMLAPLANVRVPLDGSVRVAMTAGGEVDSAWFDITGGRGSVVIPALDDQVIPVDRFRSRGRIGDGLSLWQLEEVAIDLGGPSASATGTLTNTGVVVQVGARATLRNFSAADLTRFWPAEAAAKVRRWVTDNLTAGTAHEIDLEVTARAPKDDLRRVKLQAVTATAAYSGVTLRYHDELPPLTEATGSVRLIPNDTETALPAGFDFDVQSALLGGLAVRDGGIKILGVDQEDQRVETRFSARGRLRRLLEILDSPFIGLTDDLGIDPAGIGGHVSLRLALEFPLVADLRQEQIARTAEATMNGVTMEQGPFGLALSEGQANLQYSGSEMQAQGAIRMNGVPATFVWVRNVSPEAEFRTRFTAQGILGDPYWAALGADILNGYMTGPVTAELIYTDIDQSRQFVTLAANLRDTYITVPELHWQKQNGVDGVTRLRVELVAYEPVEISDFRIAAGDLVASGRGRFDPENAALMRFDFDKLQYGGEAGQDIAMGLARRPDGGLDVTLSGERFNAEPYLQGDAARVDFPVGLKTDLKHVRLNQDRMLANVVAGAAFDGQVWRRIELDADLREEGTDVRVHAVRQADGELAVALAGERFNAEPYLDGQDELVDFPLTLRASLEQLRLSPARILASVGAAARFDGEFWRVIELCAGLPEGGEIELRYRPEADQQRLVGDNVCPALRQGGPVDLAFWPEGRQQLIIYSDDAGAALRAFSEARMFEAIRGGELGLVAYKTLAPEQQPFEGHMQIRSFRLEDAPLMARLLSAASVVGVGDILVGRVHLFRQSAGDRTRLGDEPCHCAICQGLYGYGRRPCFDRGRGNPVRAH
jgi:hypothetical protein